MLCNMEFRRSLRQRICAYFFSGKLSITLLYVVLIFLTLISSRTLAGSVEGPYLVWVNLGTIKPERADKKITEFVNGQDSLCWEDGALLYMRKRPSGITSSLVKRALQLGDTAAQRQLRFLLNKPFDEVPGFDGIVAYADDGIPRLLSLGMSGSVRVEAIKNAHGQEAWGATFCRLMPPISRTP